MYIPQKCSGQFVCTNNKNFRPKIAFNGNSPIPEVFCDSGLFLMRVITIEFLHNNCRFKTLQLSSQPGSYEDKFQ